MLLLLSKAMLKIKIRKDFDDEITVINVTLVGSSFPQVDPGHGTLKLHNMVIFT